MCQIELILFFFNDSFGIKWPTKVYILLNNEINQTNITKIGVHVIYLVLVWFFQMP